MRLQDRLIIKGTALNLIAVTAISLGAWWDPKISLEGGIRKTYQ